jgi:hypothetical protein
MREGRWGEVETDFEALVLEDLLDGNVFTVAAIEKLCLEDDTEGSVADDFAVGVGDVFGLSGLSVGGNDFDYLVGLVDGWKRMGTIGDDEGRWRGRGGATYGRF